MGNRFHPGPRNPLDGLPNACKICRRPDSVGGPFVVDGIEQRKCGNCGHVQYTTFSPTKPNKHELLDRK